MDRISELPEGIIESILCLLPIKEAVRTSILSRGWRYRWTTIPRLKFHVLDPTFVKPSKRKGMSRRRKLFYAINEVLCMHQGPIHEFILVVDDSRVEIDHIILQLSKKNSVKVLVLQLVGQYTLPLRFFRLHQLTELVLVGCVLDLPPSFNGFGSLTELYLENIWTSEKSFLRLLSGCPLLKDLSLNIDWRWKSDRGTIFISDSGDATIVDFFECLPCVEFLSFWFYIILNFHPDRLPKKLPTALVHLKRLRLERLSFSHKYGLPFIVLLIRSSPNLEDLEIELDSIWFEELATGTFTLEDYSDVMLEHLKVFKILYFSNGKHELDFVKLILSKSPVLKKATIVLAKSQDEESEGGESQAEESEASQILGILLSSPCASPVVEFTVGYKIKLF